MKKIFIKILIIFSLTLNFVFIFNYIKTYQKNYPKKLLSLNLSSTQKLSINELNQKYHKKDEELKRRIYFHQNRLINILDSKKPDEEAISDCIKNINSIQKKVEEITVKKILEIKKILNPEQCNYLTANFKENIEHNTALCKKECCNPKMRGVTENELKRKSKTKKNQINIL